MCVVQSLYLKCSLPPGGRSPACASFPSRSRSVSRGSTLLRACVAPAQASTARSGCTGLVLQRPPGLPLVPLLLGRGGRCLSSLLSSLPLGACVASGHDAVVEDDFALAV